MTHLISVNHTLFIAYATLGLLSLGILLLFLFNLLYALIRKPAYSMIKRVTRIRLVR